MNYETRKTAELIPYANNAKKHSDEQIKKIAASIKEFGFINPVIVDSENGIIAGHARVMAAEKLKLKEVPVLLVEHLTEAQKKAYILADNRLAEIGTEWDMELVKIELDSLDGLGFDIELTGFDRLSEEKTCTKDVIDRKSWQYFSKYHYLSDKLPGGLIKLFGLFDGENQIGFQCFANYTPRRRQGEKIKMHFNRTVIHPDYVGFGLGIKPINETSEIMRNDGFEVWAKFSSIPVYKALVKCPQWTLMDVRRFTPSGTINLKRTTGFRNAVKTYSFKYTPERATTS